MAKNNKLMQVGAAADAAGVSRQTLQYYLMLGLLEPTEYSKGGRRLFNRDCIDRIKLIKSLNQSGYTLRAIRDLFMEKHTDVKGRGNG